MIGLAEAAAALPQFIELGGEVAKLATSLIDALRIEHPHLVTEPLPAGLPEVDAARDEAEKRVGGGA